MCHRFKKPRKEKFWIGLSNNFVNEISKVFHWQIAGVNSSANVEEWNFKDDLTAKNTMSAI